MMKVLIKHKDGTVSVFHKADKSILTNEQICDKLRLEYPNSELRIIQESDIPEDRDFRNAWVDVTKESTIDICCNRAKEIALEQLRAKRNRELEGLDKEALKALENGLDLSDIISKKQQLRDVTEPLKALKAEGKVNDRELLEEIRKLRDDSI